MSDVIDTLAGIAPGSPLDAIRDQRPAGAQAGAGELRRAVRAASDADASKLERFAIACFVAGLHGRPEIGGVLRRRAGRSRRIGRAAQAAIGAAVAAATGRRSLRPLSQRAAQRRGQGRARSIASRRRRATRSGRAARGGLRAHAHAGVPSARCGAAVPAGAARCRLVDHRHRDRSRSSSPFCPIRSGSSPDCAS